MRLAESFPTFSRLLQRWEPPEARSRLVRNLFAFIVGCALGYGALWLGYRILGQLWRPDFFSPDFDPQWWTIWLLFSPAIAVLLVSVGLIIAKRTRAVGLGMLLITAVLGF
jgi:hypothetical protein